MFASGLTKLAAGNVGNKENMTYIRIATGDALTVLRQIPSESVHSCVTSPPYWRVRDYEADGQIGLEPTPQEFVERLCGVFDEVRRVLRPDGTCWIVLGDKVLQERRRRKSEIARVDPVAVRHRNDPQGIDPAGTSSSNTN